ncbi:MAG: DUF3341 domain-containing protein, partial [Chloroflexota bacterium]
DIKAFSPYRVEGLAGALGLESNILPWIAFIALFVGAAIGFSMQYYTDVISYSLNVGGRPLNSWPSFTIITFELAILFTALATAGGMLILNGLPLPYHPIFNTPNFELASGNKFYLCIEARDKQFDRVETLRFLSDLNPKSVNEATG